MTTLATHQLSGQVTQFGQFQVVILGDYAVLAGLGNALEGDTVSLTCGFLQYRAPELMFPIRGIDDYGTIISDTQLLDWIVTRGQLHPRMEIEATSSAVKLTQMFLRELDLSTPGRLHAVMPDGERVEIRGVFKVAESQSHALLSYDNLPAFLTEVVPCYQIARDIVGPAAIGLINQAIASPERKLEITMAAMNEFLDGMA